MDLLPAITETIQNTSTVTAADREVTAAEVTAGDREMTAQVDITAGTSSQDNGQAASVVPSTQAVIIIAAVLGSILGLILVGGAVAGLIVCLVLCGRRSSHLHKGVIAAVQGIRGNNNDSHSSHLTILLFFFPSVDSDDHQVKSQDTNEYASVEDRGSVILMKDNSAYMCSSTHSQESISTDYNIAYYSSNRVKHEDDLDNVYEYI